MSPSEQVITIDGGAHTGKSTAARRLAEWLHWDWVSTGAFYRGLAHVADTAGVSEEDEQGLARLVRTGELKVDLAPDATRFLHRGTDITNELFTARVSELTPRISRWPAVRAELLDAQRRLARHGRGLISEGRDCGTVVFPQALLKFYFTVNDEAAAQRYAGSHGVPIELAFRHVRDRNDRDARRTTARMVPADDALHLDTSHHDPDAVLAWLQHHCRQNNIGPEK